MVAPAVAVLGGVLGVALLSSTSFAVERDRAGLRATLASARAAPHQLAAGRAIAVPGGGSIRHFSQRVDGLPVHGAEAIVIEPTTGAPELVVDHTVARLLAPRSAELGRHGAISRARRSAGAVMLRARPRAELGVDPVTRRLAWEVQLPAAHPLADLLVSVDAVNGRVIRSRDLLRRATATASLFSPNPIVTQGSSSGLRDAKDRGSMLLASLRVPVTLERLASRRGCLRGEYAEARLGREGEPVCRRSRSWSNVGRSQGSFEALMAYYHVDRTRAYVESLSLTRGFRKQPQLIRANSFPQDNSFFSPFDRTIGLGTGGVDDGEDADVIVHEYGHSLQDQQRHLFGSTLAGVAIGEGFGDYLAAAISSFSTAGEERFDTCMFEWDAVSYTQRRCARRTDKEITLKRANRRCDREPHCVGEAWSSALWDLRGELGVDSASRSVGDRVVLQSHFMYARRTGYRDAARALIAADKLLYAGANGEPIEAEMLERGFCSKPGC